MKIQIYSDSPDAMRDLFGDSVHNLAEPIQLCSDLNVSFTVKHERKLIETPDVIEFFVTLATGTAASYFANWLYKKLRKNRVRRLFIDEIEVEFEEEKIKKAVFRQYTREHSE